MADGKAGNGRLNDALERIEEKMELDDCGCWPDVVRASQRVRAFGGGVARLTSGPAAGIGARTRESVAKTRLISRYRNLTITISRSTVWAFGAQQSGSGGIDNELLKHPKSTRASVDT